MVVRRLRLVDFLVVHALDAGSRWLAADRDSTDVREYYQSLHPAVFEVLGRLAKILRAWRRFAQPECAKIAASVL